MADQELTVAACLRSFAAGRAVVVVGEDGALLGRVVADLSDHGRIALVVGTIEADRAAAETMGTELFPDGAVDLVDAN